MHRRLGRKGTAKREDGWSLNQRVTACALRRSSAVAVWPVEADKKEEHLYGSALFGSVRLCSVSGRTTGSSAVIQIRPPKSACEEQPLRPGEYFAKDYFGILHHRPPKRQTAERLCSGRAPSRVAVGKLMGGEAFAVEAAVANFWPAVLSTHSSLLTVLQSQPRLTGRFAL